MSAGRELAAQPLGGGDVARLVERPQLLLERLADARQLGDAALARELHRPRRRTRARPWRPCGRRSRGTDDRAVELVEVAELLEGGGDLGVGGGGDTGGSSRLRRGLWFPARLPIQGEMHLERMAIVQGWGDTRAALRALERAARPPSLGPWLLGSLAVAVRCCCATWAIAAASARPDLTRVGLAGVDAPATVGDYLFILYRNGLVLALHAHRLRGRLHRRLVAPARRRAATRGVWRRVHDLAGPAADRLRRGRDAVLARHAGVRARRPRRVRRRAARDVARPLLLALCRTRCPSCARCSCRSRRGRWPSRRRRWNELLAATFVTTRLAVPVLLAAPAPWRSGSPPHVLYFLK